MALFSFRHSIKTFSERRTEESRVEEQGQTAAHLRYTTRPKATRLVVQGRLSSGTQAKAATHPYRGRSTQAHGNNTAQHNGGVAEHREFDGRHVKAAAGNRPPFNQDRQTDRIRRLVGIQAGTASGRFQSLPQPRPGRKPPFMATGQQNLTCNPWVLGKTD
ncbi:MAG: hypothetical protein ABJH45_18855 [Paracoccaceae bacterium]